MEVVLPLFAHQLAVQQARAHAKIARTIAKDPRTSDRPADVLAFLVNAGLSIELYLKALMVAGRGGRVRTGHDLTKLVAEFPPFLLNEMEEHYRQGSEWRVFEVTMIALTIRDVSPQTPQSPVPLPPFGTFGHAIQSLSQVFETCRYFFERVGDEDWCHFAYSPLAVDAAFNALDHTYEKFRVGGFAEAASRGSGGA